MEAVLKRMALVKKYTSAPLDDILSDFCLSKLNYHMSPEMVVDFLKFVKGVINEFHFLTKKFELMPIQFCPEKSFLREFLLIEKSLGMLSPLEAIQAQEDGHAVISGDSFKIATSLLQDIRTMFPHYFKSSRIESLKQNYCISQLDDDDDSSHNLTWIMHVRNVSLRIIEIQFLREMQINERVGRLDGEKGFSFYEEHEYIYVKCTDRKFGIQKFRYLTVESSILEEYSLKHPNDTYKRITKKSNQAILLYLKRLMLGFHNSSPKLFLLKRVDQESYVQKFLDKDLIKLERTEAGQLNCESLITAMTNLCSFFYNLYICLSKDEDNLDIWTKPLSTFYENFNSFTLLEIIRAGTFNDEVLKFIVKLHALTCKASYVVYSSYDAERKVMNFVELTRSMHAIITQQRHKSLAILRCSTSVPDGYLESSTSFSAKNKDGQKYYMYQFPSEYTVENAAAV